MYNMTAFNSPLNAFSANMKITQIILVPSGTFDNMMHRCVAPEINQNQIDGITQHIQERANMAISPIKLMEFAPGISNIQEHTNTSIHIPNGFQTMRLNFVIKGYFESADKSTQSFFDVRGYTDHYCVGNFQSVSVASRLDKNAEWYITAFNSYNTVQNNNGAFCGMTANNKSGLVISPTNFNNGSFGTGSSSTKFVTPSAAVFDKIDLFRGSEEYLNRGGNTTVLNNEQNLIDANTVSFDIANPTFSLANAIGEYATGLSATKGTTGDPLLIAFDALKHNHSDVSATSFMACLHQKSMRANRASNIFTFGELIAYDPSLANSMDNRISIFEGNQLMASLDVPGMGNDWATGGNVVLTAIAQRIAVDMATYLAKHAIQSISVRMTNVREDMGAAPHENAGFGLYLNFGDSQCPQPVFIHDMVPVASYSVSNLGYEHVKTLSNSMMQSINSFLKLMVWPYITRNNTMAARCKIEMDMSVRTEVNIQVMDVGSGRWICPTSAISAMNYIYTNNNQMANAGYANYNGIFNNLAGSFQSNQYNPMDEDNMSGFTGALASFNSMSQGMQGQANSIDFDKFF